MQEPVESGILQAYMLRGMPTFQTTNLRIKGCVSGEDPAVIEIPIFYTHNIENVGAGDLYTLFWANEVYDPDDGDTFYEKV
jgi:dTDP-4-dehydrorhamnose 3,5-epimerase-like enzyme